MSKLDELIKYDITTAAIEKMREEFLTLEVKGFDDTENYKLCHKARMTVRSHRLAIEERRKELKADSIAFGRKVDTAAKDIKVQLEEIESHLQAQQDIIDNEKARVKREAEELRRQHIQDRVTALAQVGVHVLEGIVAEWSEEEFNDTIVEATNAFEAKRAKEEADQAELAKLRAEQAEKDAELEKQKAENKKLQDEIIAKQQAEIDEKNRQIAAEAQAKADREAEAQRIADEAEEEKQRIADEEAAVKEKADAAAAKKVADKKLYEAIKKAFPTIEECWVEIARLKKGESK